MRTTKCSSSEQVSAERVVVLSFSSTMTNVIAILFRPSLIMTDGHMVNTNCSNSHLRRDLCCKMSTEFDTFLESRKK